MRREKPRPVVVTALSLLFVTIYFAFIFGRTTYVISRLFDQFGFVPEKMGMPGEWYRILTASGVHENGLFVLISVVFLLVLGGPLELRRGAGYILTVFVGATLISYAAFSVLAWGQGVILLGSLAGTGGVVGAWVMDAFLRIRVSSKRNVVMKDLEEMPAVLTLILWFFAVLVPTVLLSEIVMPLFLAVAVATFSGSVIHLAFAHRRGKLSL